MIELIIFDLDGTLAETYTLNLLPGVGNFFQLVSQAGCPLRPRLAIATNQGGVGMRYWMERAGFGRPVEYPKEQDIERRLKGILALLGLDPSLPVYASYRYQTRAGKWAPVPEKKREEPRWSESWRKPQPGMLLQAMRDAGATPQATLFVGDSPDDLDAAQAAGCHFEWAGDFFTRSWKDCADLARYLHDGPAEPPSTPQTPFLRKPPGKH